MAVRSLYLGRVEIVVYTAQTGLIVHSARSRETESEPASTGKHAKGRWRTRSEQSSSLLDIIIK